MKRLSFIIALIAILISSCTPTPSPSQIQTAIPTAIRTATPKPTLAPTQTPTPTTTPDLRIIIADPQEFLLTRADFQPEDLYYLANEEWNTIETNEEAIETWPVKEGQDFLNETGRETGWWISYTRGTEELSIPKQVRSHVVRFKTSAGALLALTKFGIENRDIADKYTKVDTDLALGDYNVSYFHTINAPNGETNIIYDIYFSYYNFVGRVEGYGLEKDVDPAFLEDLARKMLEKLEAATLEEPAP